MCPCSVYLSSVNIHTPYSQSHFLFFDFFRPPGASTSPSAPVVYCVHGNKWGVAQCCQDLGEEHEELVHCHTDRQEGVDKKWVDIERNDFTEITQQSESCNSLQVFFIAKTYTFGLVL